MTMSAPASQASHASAKSRHSISTLDEKPATALATRHASAIDPAAHTWLSLSMTICDKSSRCVAQPPTSSAYFSTMRKPGVVLRVPATAPRHVAGTAARAVLAAVATPDARASVLSAVRSPSSRSRAGPVTVATATLPPGAVDASTRAPSSTSHSTVQPPPRASKVHSKNGTPASTPSDLPQSVAVTTRSPTTSPPTSTDGTSSRTHRATSSRQCGGSTARIAGVF
mmetsp:Transcript_100/g.392  ORF Transcript_100/g.392 Transcript_100/m.392 type:complete len:226 (-) Transcript_100:10-687(-)